jgi:photosystem II stability/assembly factor-like uncharacterized protein
VFADPTAPRTAYASAAGSLYRSSDSGRSWAKRGYGRTPLLFDPSAHRFYTSSCCPGVGYSDDEGETWQDSAVGLPDTGYVNHLARDPSTGVLYAALAGIESYDDGGVWRSDDDGATWHPVNAGLAGKALDVLVAHPRVPGLVYACDADAAWRSDDGGISWQPLAAMNGYCDALAVSPAAADVVWMASGNVVRRSGDRGQSWGDGIQIRNVIRALAIDPGDPRIGYAGLSRGGIAVTDDGGATWTTLQIDGASGVPVLSLAIDERFPARIYAGTDGAGVQILVRGARLPCAADCDASGVVEVNEVIAAVGIALGRTDVARCPSADADDDGTITIDDLIRAVGAALGGCTQ